MLEPRITLLAAALLVSVAAGVGAEVGAYRATIAARQDVPAPAGLSNVDDDPDDGAPATCDECVRDSDCESLCGVEAHAAPLPFPLPPGTSSCSALRPGVWECDHG